MQNLKKVRKQNKKNQAEIAEALNITQQQYSLYESGKRKIDSETLKKVCLYFNVSADYILDLPKGLNYPDNE